MSSDSDTDLCKAQSAYGDVNITNLNEHVKAMDAVLQEVQAHSEAQQQKYSAVLSSVLSQLTQTVEELNTNKNVTEELQRELQELTSNKNATDELEMKVENLEHEYTTAMAELEEMKQKHNQSIIELEMVKDEVKSLEQDLRNCSGSFSKSGLSQLTSTQTEIQPLLHEIAGQMNASGRGPGSNRPLLPITVGFEARLDQSQIVSAKGKVVFDKVIFNEGNGYNKTTGYFTAPVSGTYLLWTNMVYRSKNIQPSIAFYITTLEKSVGLAFGSAGDEAYDTASATTIFNLKKGESVWITPSKNVELKSIAPSAGAVLLQQH